VLTAIAAYYRDKSAAERENPSHWFATASLKVDFLKPTPLERPVQLRARVTEMQERKALLACSLFSDGEECARGEVVAVRVLAGKGPARKI